MYWFSKPWFSISRETLVSSISPDEEPEHTIVPQEGAAVQSAKQNYTHSQGVIHTEIKCGCEVEWGKRSLSEALTRTYKADKNTCNSLQDANNYKRFRMW